MIAVNAFPTDHASEHRAIMEIAEEEGVRVAISHHFTQGGKGAVELAEAVAEACSEPTNFHRLYADGLPLVDKIDVIAREMYGADGVDLSPLAARQLEKYERAGFGELVPHVR